MRWTVGSVPRAALPLLECNEAAAMSVPPKQQQQRWQEYGDMDRAC